MLLNLLRGYSLGAVYLFLGISTLLAMLLVLCMTIVGIVLFTVCVIPVWAIATLASKVSKKDFVDELLDVVNADLDTINAKLKARRDAK